MLHRAGTRRARGLSRSRVPCRAWIMCAVCAADVKADVRCIRRACARGSLFTSLTPHVSVAPQCLRCVVSVPAHPHRQPLLHSHPLCLSHPQAKNTAEVIVNYQLWRLVTPIMLHAGLIHLATNLLMQLRLGLFLEIQWGTKTWLPIYFGSGIFASLWSMVLKADSIGVGASGGW